MDTLKKEYRIPAFLSFKVGDRYDTIEFVCGVCGIAIRDLDRVQLVFNRETGQSLVACAFGRAGCSGDRTRETHPQSTTMAPLIQRMARRNGSAR